jgi:hypothetical protein
MDNMKKERLKEILLNPQDFTYRIDVDSWVIFKKKEDIKNLTTKELIESKSYYLKHVCDFTKDILDELNIDVYNID